MQQQPSPQNKRNWLLIGGIGCVVILTLILCLGVVVLFGSSENGSKPGSHLIRQARESLASNSRALF